MSPLHEERVTLSLVSRNFQLIRVLAFCSLAVFTHSSLSVHAATDLKEQSCVIVYCSYNHDYCVQR